MKRVLFIATVVKQHIMVFHLPYFEWFHKNGYEVHIAAKNDYDIRENCIIPFCDRFYDLPFSRFPLDISNYSVLWKLRRIIRDNHYDIIHCHTPVGGALGRLAANKYRKYGTRIIYTAHGFHFYNGAPLINWLVYYPIERWLSKYTDVLITINSEDYRMAKSRFKAKRIEYVPGIGIDFNKFRNLGIVKDFKLSELGIPNDSFVVLSVGELNKNKNHEVIIRAIKKINNSNIHYIICGQGPLKNYLLNISNKLGIKNQVHFLGFRNDIDEICKVSDLFAFPSYREGLSVAMMEAMANGLAIVCSKIRGNIDLIEENKGGYLVQPEDTCRFAKYIDELSSDSKLRNQFGKFNSIKASFFSIEKVMPRMNEIYFN